MFLCEQIILSQSSIAKKMVIGTLTIIFLKDPETTTTLIKRYKVILKSADIAYTYTMLLEKGHILKK